MSVDLSVGEARQARDRGGAAVHEAAGPEQGGNRRRRLAERVRRRFPGDPFPIAADREQIDQVLANLATNARYAMPDGGRLTLSVEQDGAFAHFRVADDGQGMGSESARIFEPFFTTRRTGGTGLGLPVAQQIVHRHGGTIYAESTPGRGSVFHFLLPLAESTTNPEALSNGVADAAPRRLLLVEDDEAVAAGLQAVLDVAGHEIVLAINGLDAKQRLAFFRADAVILDIGLPDIDGVALYSELTAVRPGLPVVFSTGHGDASKLQHLLSLPHVAFLQKPYASDELLTQIARVTAQRAGALL